MSRPARVGDGLASLALIAPMRGAPALFTVGWLAAAADWLAQGRLERALAVAAVAASFGARTAPLQSPRAERPAFRVSQGFRKIRGLGSPRGFHPSEGGQDEA